jgi:hypothetical protein
VILTVELQMQAMEESIRQILPGFAVFAGCEYIDVSVYVQVGSIERFVASVFIGARAVPKRPSLQ